MSVKDDETNSSVKSDIPLLRKKEAFTDLMRVKQDLMSNMLLMLKHFYLELLRIVPQTP